MDSDADTAVPLPTLRRDVWAELSDRCAKALQPAANAPLEALSGLRRLRESVLMMIENRGKSCGMRYPALVADDDLNALVDAQLDAMASVVALLGSVPPPPPQGEAVLLQVLGHQMRALLAIGSVSHVTPD